MKLHSVPVGAEIKRRAKLLPATVRIKAQELYQLGLESRAIALKLGLPDWQIRRWISSGGWPKQRQSRSLAAVEAIEDYAFAQARLDQQCREKTIYEANLDHLAKLKPRSPKTAKEAAECARIYSDLARRNLGMVDETASKMPTMTFNFSAGRAPNVKLAEKVTGSGQTRAVSPAPAPTIDVETSQSVDSE